MAIGSRREERGEILSPPTLLDFFFSTRLRMVCTLPFQGTPRSSQPDPGSGGGGNLGRVGVDKEDCDKRHRSSPVAAANSLLYALRVDPERDARGAKGRQLLDNSGGDTGGDWFVLSVYWRRSLYTPEYFQINKCLVLI